VSTTRALKSAVEETPRKRQLKQRLQAGADWVETGLVFTTCRHDHGQKMGTGLHPRNVLRTLHRLLKAAKLPRVRRNQGWYDFIAIVLIVLFAATAYFSAVRQGKISAFPHRGPITFIGWFLLLHVAALAFVGWSCAWATFWQKVLWPFEKPATQVDPTKHVPTD
jgi:hypothetical protein